MVYATKKSSRLVWIIGAVLLGVVVVKLLFIDLSKLQTLAKTISFLSLGILLTLVGWLSPVPPSSESTK
ncbi:MAG: DUF2339 domain-containing protein [Deltaproteobacteria bacterium]|nr:DUF2339 domain-containing protein [Deltaproteobacteria bacterium]